MSNTLTDKNETAAKHFYRASAADFKKIPGAPVAYWTSSKLRAAFADRKMVLGDIANPNQALVTGNTELYIRKWFEVSIENIGFHFSSRDAAKESCLRWFPYNKGGDFRNWYGNLEHIVDWQNDGQKLQTTLHPSGNRIWAHNFVLDSIFKEAIVWSKITSGKPCFRYSPDGYLYDDASGVCSFVEGKRAFVVGLLCSKVNFIIQQLINPTLNIQPANLRDIPLPLITDINIDAVVEEILSFSCMDWNSFECSWGFTKFPLIGEGASRLIDSYRNLRSNWQSTTTEMQKLEEENNRIFIEAYGLQNELTPEVPLKEITLTCNPHYRYGGDKSEAELEALLLADTMREFISYAVGCMFGRYSVDEPGLILANQGETLEDYLRKVPEPRFMPDADNVIPLIDFEGDWFEDDISERFKQFLKVTFGEEHFQENLQFIEDALGKDIRKFFLKDFYNDHTKRYKKRPIYWLFSSPKGSFNALIYMHRYRPDTASVVLNDYLREFRTKLSARKESYEQTAISISASPADKAKALKNIEKINKVLEEVNDYERDILYPLAGKNIAIDLDDGVKKNYLLFGNALKKISGLDAKDES